MFFHQYKNWVPPGQSLRERFAGMEGPPPLESEAYMLGVKAVKFQAHRDHWEVLQDVADGDLTLNPPPTELSGYQEQEPDGRKLQVELINIMNRSDREVARRIIAIRRDVDSGRISLAARAEALAKSAP